MRLGGSILLPYSGPEEWVRHVKELHYSAVIAPMEYDDAEELKKEYITLAKEENIIFAEVGAWVNPIAPDKEEQKRNLDYCKKQLALADEIGANCCVNVVGSTGVTWDGFYQANYSEKTYDLIVESIREIIDSVKPTKTFYTIEPMPWMIPDSPDSYLKLLKDVDRERFGVHLDFVNMINSPRRYLFSNEFIKECFDKLGPYTKSIHIKDVIMRKKFTVVIEETMVGEGTLDYSYILKLVESLGKETPALVEHLKTHEEYLCASEYIRKAAREADIYLVNE